MDLNSFSNQPAPQIVLAGSGTPARVFTAADYSFGTWTNYTLIANGLSANPTFPAGWTQYGSGSYNNVAGCMAWIGVGHDGWDSYYSVQPSTAVTHPIPTAFVGSNGSQVLTVTFAGAALATAALPSGSWFSLSGSRPGTSSPLPYSIAATVASLSGTSLVLNITGGTFATGDLVVLSYEPTPPGNPLKDAATGLYKVSGFTATVTVQ